MPELATAASSAEQEKESMPTMGFLDHLEELRKRIVYSVFSVGAGTAVCWFYRERIYGVMQKPIMDALHSQGLPEKLVYLNPIDPFNLYLKVSMLAGLFLTSPLVLYQVWMFISPGLYRNEKKYALPFMVSTITLFTLGGYFGYRVAYPRALDFFVVKFNGQFQPMITINEYTQLFLSIVAGLGLIFEMPILVFFLAFLGIMTPSFMIKNFRYAILVMFILAAIVTPTPDVVNMCVFAAPMIGLYALSIGVAWLVHPKQRAKRQAKEKQA
jgi:sec-independent protein translocase protein TatC